jgi:hypothetical protein
MGPGFKPLTPLESMGHEKGTVEARARTSQFSVPLLVRRAKLGLVSRGQVPAPEALARHRIPSVAWPKATTAAKRTQGVDGPQCASVKGLSPVMNRDVGADMLSNMEGHIQGAKGQGSHEPTGVEDRGTSTGQGWELGRSDALLQSGVGLYNRHTGRRPDGASEVGCPHTSEDAG